MWGVLYFHKDLFGKLTERVRVCFSSQALTPQRLTGTLRDLNIKYELQRIEHQHVK